MSKAKTECPNPFPITDKMLAWAREHVPRLDIKYHTEEMVDWCLANAKKFADWIAMWRNWMRRAMTFPGVHLLPLVPRYAEHPKVSDIFQNSGTMSRQEALKRFGPS